MNLLLDTCAIIYLGIDDPSVTATTRRLVRDAERIFVSPISSAELACLQERGRIKLPVHWKPWLREAIETNGWDVKPITLEIMEEAYSLPESFHPDPADRILTATARREDLVLLTTDRKLLAYPHLQARW
jgi:PIN domain nuclease of toxin-antitoxin system